MTNLKEYINYIICNNASNMIKDFIVSFLMVATTESVHRITSNNLRSFPYDDVGDSGNSVLHIHNRFLIKSEMKNRHQ